MSKRGEKHLSKDFPVKRAPGNSLVLTNKSPYKSFPEPPKRTLPRLSSMPPIKKRPDGPALTARKLVDEGHFGKHPDCTGCLLVSAFLDVEVSVTVKS
ncbi:MAG: hypothetical protein R3346_03910 [Candidatus Spechtbacterales bacterium]|nr:hypothetical protein [Candidatus Spechtbacterales bacterium]